MAYKSKSEKKRIETLRKEKEYIVKLKPGTISDEFQYENKMITKKGTVIKSKEARELKKIDEKKELDFIEI